MEVLGSLDINRVAGGEESENDGGSSGGEEIERSEESGREDRRGRDPPFGTEDVECASDDSTAGSGKSTQEDLVHQGSANGWVRMRGRSENSSRNGE